MRLSDINNDLQREILEIFLSAFKKRNQRVLTVHDTPLLPVLIGLLKVANLNFLQALAFFENSELRVRLLQTEPAPVADPDIYQEIELAALNEANFCFEESQHQNPRWIRFQLVGKKRKRRGRPPAIPRPPVFDYYIGVTAILWDMRWGSPRQGSADARAGLLLETIRTRWPRERLYKRRRGLPRIPRDFRYHDDSW